MDRKSLGNQGEIKAIKFLRGKSYRILDKNYRKRTGEIDIIAFDPNFNEYVFIEVKTRRSLKFGYPEESVDENKMLKLIETAENWLLENEKFDVEWRVDIISIEWKNKKEQIKHIQNIS